MFPEPIINYIHKAGWYPERNVTIPASKIYLPDNVLAILKEFNGLHFKPTGSSGQECATGDILIDFSADHLIDNSECEILDKYGIKCFFIGISHNGYCELHSDSNGIIYSPNIIDDDLGFVGSNIYESITNIINGIRKRPIIKRGEDSVTFYGDKYLLGDPRVYTP